MAMGRGLKVYHNLPQCGVAVPSLTGEDQVYSLVIEQRTKNEVILLEYINNNYIIISQGKETIKNDLIPMPYYNWFVDFQASTSSRLYVKTTLKSLTGMVAWV